MLWKPGMALISILELDLVCFVDLENETIVWAESDLWRRQHQPTVLDNGNILVLNNHATEYTSSVFEFDPVSKERVWYYGAETGNFFRTDTCGTGQRLPNGNTLITESDPGRSFEVTPDKTIVWEWISPHRAGDEGLSWKPAIGSAASAGRSGAGRSTRRSAENARCATSMKGST